MAIELKVVTQDVKIRRGKLNFNSYFFKKELNEIIEQNKIIDRSIKFDYTKFFRHYDQIQ